MKERRYKWYKIDNSAIVYQMIITPYAQSLFRLGATLAESVKKPVLVGALEKAFQRHPYFRCELKKGFFRPYFDENPQSFVVEKDDGKLLNLKYLPATVVVDKWNSKDAKSFHCPTEKMKPGIMSINRHYGLNYRTFGSGPSHATLKPKKIGSLKSNFIYIGESLPTGYNGSTNLDSYRIQHYGGVYPMQVVNYGSYPVFARHSSKANILFANCSVSTCDRSFLRDVKNWEEQ